MAHAATIPARYGEPLGEMNTTPLIDAMLVLLVMLILAVPVAVHQLPFDLPTPPPTSIQTPIRPQNDLTIDAQGQPAWNGKTLSEAALFSVLQQAASLNPDPRSRNRRRR